MTARNDITGDAIKSKPLSQKGRDNWDAIFGKKQSPCYNKQSPVEPEADGVGTSGKESNGQT